MFYKEFGDWINHQNFNNKVFKENKIQLFLRLEYLRLIHLLFNKKSLRLFFNIIKYPVLISKIKLLIIYFLPKFILRFKYKYL